MPVPWRKEEKYVFLEKAGPVAGVKWKTLKRDNRGNWITNATDEEYIVRLIGRVITVSVETQKIIGALPALQFD